MSANKIVYLVDDDEVAQFITTKIIRIRFPDMVIQPFSDLDDAIQALQDSLGRGLTLPDLIFLDFHVSNRSALDFLDSYKPLVPLFPKPVKLCLLSAESEDRFGHMPLVQELVDKWISKPLQPQLLDTLISA